MIPVNFTKEQYETLLKMAYMGNWMVNAHRADDVNEEFNALEEYLFSQTPLFGLEHCSNEEEPAIPSGEFEMALLEDQIEEYNNETFWDELAERLALRHIGTLYTEEQINKMDPMEGLELIIAHEEKLKEEFSTNGIDNLVLKS